MPTPEARFKIAATDATAGTFASVEKRMGGMKKQAFDLKKAFSGLAGLAGVAGIGAIGKGALETANRLRTFSQVTSFSTSTIQGFEFAAREMGLQSAAADTALQRFSRRVAEVAAGTGVLKKEFDRYNISVRDANGNIRDSEELLRAYANVVANAESEQEALRLAVQAFDIEGGRFVQVLKQGAQGIDALADKSRKLGQSMSDDTIRRLSDARNVLEGIKQTATVGFGTALGFVGFGFEALFKPFFRDPADFKENLRLAKEASSFFQREWHKRQAQRKAAARDEEIAAAAPIVPSEEEIKAAFENAQRVYEKALKEQEELAESITFHFEEATGVIDDFGETSHDTFTEFIKDVAKSHASIKDFGSLLRNMLIEDFFGAVFPKGVFGGGGGGVFKGIGKALGFQHGGSFTVGGAGGADSQMVAFRATPGERVTVTPPGQGGSAIHFEQHIHIGEGVNQAAEGAVLRHLEAIQAFTTHGIIDARIRGGIAGGRI